MRVSRRHFVGSLAATPVVLAPQPLFAAVSAPAVPAKLRPAIGAIADYAEAHRRAMGVPGVTVGLIAPGLPGHALRLGHVDTARTRSVSPDTLFQVGSISKLMTALMVHQLAAEGKLALNGDVRAMLPGAAWPDGPPVTLQQLMDHVAGLPGNAPLFPAEGKLWLNYAPGSQWHYSNTGYGLLGLIVERAERAPLAAVLHRRLFAPLGMRRSYGAILSADRLRYQQGYEPARREILYVPGDPLSPAPWTDVSFGAGSVASTADDMNRLMQSILAAATGTGGLGLSPALATAFTTHAVDTIRGAAAKAGDRRYGNGLMHDTDKAGRVHLHHTGGMPSFSSSFHLDPLSGAGAFASVPIGYPANYRPRLLTLFAAQALTAAAAGTKLPDPPSLAAKKIDGRDYLGTYRGPRGTLVFADGSAGFSVTADGRTGAILGISDTMFSSRHPALAAWPIQFVRHDKKVVAFAYGSDTYVRDGATHAVALSNPALARLAGRFQTDSAWQSIVTIAERGGKLCLGGADELVAQGDNRFRTTEEWSSPRLRFTDFVDGRPQTLILDGHPMERRDI